MAKRYENSKIKKNKIKRGKRIPTMYNVNSNSSTIYSSIPKSDGDIYIISQDGDRLDHLANQFYGDHNLWWYIAKANHLHFMTIPAGTSLRIPATLQYAIGR